MNDPAVHVIVMAYENGLDLLESVRSAMTQDLDEPFGVVVSSSGSEDPTEMLAAEFPAVTVLHQAARRLPGGARNAGLDSVLRRPLPSESVIAFLEGDCTAAPGWLAARVRAHRAGHPWVTGPVTYLEHPTCTQLALVLLLFHLRLPHWPAGPVPSGDPRVHGASVVASIFDDGRRFRDDSLIAEDTAFAEALEAEGLQAYFEPAALIRHGGPETMRGLIVDQFRRARRATALRVATPGLRPRVIRREARLARRRVRNALREARRVDDLGVRLLRCTPAVIVGGLAHLAGQLAAHRRGPA